MNNTTHKKGFTLTELLVVIGVMATLIGIGVPATKAMLDSVNSSAGVRNMLTAALSNARAIAIKEQSYAGIRFQPDTEGNQYMVFIVHDPASNPTLTELAADPEFTGTGLAYGFRAVKGQKPIKLPGNARVMDLKLRTNTVDAKDSAYYEIVSWDMIDDTFEFMDTSTFTVIFSPAGKLVTQQVRVRNRHGMTSNSSTDKIFNTRGQVLLNPGFDALLCQDDYPEINLELGLGQEYSRKSFLIYDRRKFDGTPATSRWPEYLFYIKDDKVYVNPYTGELVGGQFEN